MLEQYKVLLTMYNSEMNRFWTRFNIFLGLQVAIFIAMLSSSKFLVSNPSIFRFGTICVVILSLAGSLINLRGYGVQRMFINAIGKLEDESKGTLVLLKTFRRVSNVSLVVNGFIAVAVGFLMTAIWVFLLIYFETIGYTFVITN